VIGGSGAFSMCSRRVQATALTLSHSLPRGQGRHAMVPSIAKSVAPDNCCGLRDSINGDTKATEKLYAANSRVCVGLNKQVGSFGRNLAMTQELLRIAVLAPACPASQGVRLKLRGCVPANALALLLVIWDRHSNQSQTCNWLRCSPIPPVGRIGTAHSPFDYICTASVQATRYHRANSCRYFGHVFHSWVVLPRQFSVLLR
jgi:hypothetical protein